MTYLSKSNYIKLYKRCYDVCVYLIGPTWTSSWHSSSALIERSRNGSVALLMSCGGASPSAPGAVFSFWFWNKSIADSCIAGPPSKLSMADWRKLWNFETFNSIAAYTYMHRQNATEQRHNYLHIIQVRSKTHRKAIFQEHDNEKPIDVLYNELKHGWGTARY